MMIPQRISLELLYHLEHAGEFERLARALATVEIFVPLWNIERIYEILSFWKRLSDQGHDPVTLFTEGIERYRSRSATAYDRCMALAKVADFFDFQGYVDAAIDTYRIIVDLSSEPELLAPRTTALRCLGRLLFLRGELDEAMASLQEAVRCSEASGDERELSAVASAVGHIHGLRGESDLAMEWYRRQLALAERRGIAHEIGMANTNLGSLYRRMGEYAKAVACYDRNLAIALASHDRHGTALGYGNLGVIHELMGEYEQALSCYHKQREVCEQAGLRRGLAVCTSNIGTLHARQGKFDEALAWSRRSLEFYEQVGERFGISTTLANIGLMHLGLDDLKSAAASFTESIAISEAIGVTASVAIAHAGLGSIYVERGEYTEALACYRRATEMAEREKDPAARADVACRIGIMKLRQGAYDDALEELSSAVACFREAGLRPDLVESLSARALVLLSLAEAGSSEPSYLARHLSIVTDGSWRTAAMAQARRDASDALDISRAVNRLDILFESSVTLARIDAAEGAIDRAIDVLTALSRESTDLRYLARAHYWLWKIGVEEHRAEAARLYEELAATRPNVEYRKRAEELRSGGER